MANPDYSIENTSSLMVHVPLLLGLQELPARFLSVVTPNGSQCGAERRSDKKFFIHSTAPSLCLEPRLCFGKGTNGCPGTEVDGSMGLFHLLKNGYKWVCWGYNPLMRPFTNFLGHPSMIKFN